MKFDKQLKEEYFLVCKPTKIKYFLYVPSIALLIFTTIYFSLQTTYNIVYYTFITSIVLGIFVFLLNFIDLFANSGNSEIEFDTNYVLNEQKTAYVLDKNKAKYMVIYQFDNFAKTTWYSYHIVLNFMLNLFGRFIHFAYYYLKSKLPWFDYKKIHPKAIYYHLINTSLSYYIKDYSPDIEFDNIVIMCNNKNQWSCQKKEIFKAILTVDHDQCITKKMTIYESQQDFLDKTPIIITDQWEIYAIMMIFIKFVTHTHIHAYSPWIGDIDQEYLPLKQQAIQAVNGINNLILKWESLFIGSVWNDIISNGIKQGLPYHGEHIQILAERSQFYNVIKAIENDTNINFMIENSIIRKNRKRIAQGLPSYTEEEIKQKKFNLRIGISTSMAQHCMDHFCHDRFLSPLLHSEYLQFSDIIGTIFGTRWSDDIISDLHSKKQILAKSVYSVIEKHAPDLKEGFSWTVQQ